MKRTPAMPSWLPEGFRLPGRVRLDFSGGYWLWMLAPADIPYEVSDKL